MAPCSSDTIRETKTDVLLTYDTAPAQLHCAISCLFEGIFPLCQTRPDQTYLISFRPTQPQARESQNLGPAHEYLRQCLVVSFRIIRSSAHRPSAVAQANLFNIGTASVPDCPVQSWSPTWVSNLSREQTCLPLTSFTSYLMLINVITTMIWSTWRAAKPIIKLRSMIALSSTWVAYRLDDFLLWTTLPPNIQCHADHYIPKVVVFWEQKPLCRGSLARQIPNNAD